MGNRVLLGVFVFSCMTMISCSLIGCNFTAGHSREEFYDDTVLAQPGDSYSSSFLHEYLEEGGLEFKNFSGRYTVQTIAVPAGKSLTVTGNLEDVTTGLFKLVLVRKEDGLVTTITDRTGFFEQTFNQGDGDFTIKAVGYKTTGNISYTIEFGD